MEQIIEKIRERETISSQRRARFSTKYVDEELQRILEEARTKILVVGVGGAGNNTITRLMEIGIDGAETLAINTDAQDLLYTDAHHKLLIGRKLTGGLGAGNNPAVGEAAAKESYEEIKEAVVADLVFITCGLGGGTGTGAAPIVAEAAKDQGALTISICTLPFRIEGRKRIKNALMGLKNLLNVCDTVIVIPNEKLLDIVPNLSIAEAFRVADEILIRGVKGITELVTRPGLVNLDFADVKSVLENGGMSLISMSEAEGEKRAETAVKKALQNPLLDVDINGARGALINISGSQDLTLHEAEIIVENVASKLEPDAEIIWGALIDGELKGAIRITLIISGVNSPYLVESEEDLMKILLEKNKGANIDFGIEPLE
ncbi:MAG: cell division protein FtsZ [Candidatus Baldrarchaeota archaeon]